MEQPRRHIDFRSHPARGPTRYFAAIIDLLPDDQGRPVQLAGTVLDITERKRAEDEVRQLNATLEQRVASRTAELQHANRELEAFSYSVSHDLRAPLRAISGFSEILLAEHGAELSPPAQKQLRRIMDASARMGMLIDDLLNLSRVTQQEMMPAAVDLSQIATAIAEELRQSEPARVVEWVIAQHLIARGDPNLLRVALDNLLRNAWKFTSKKPAARIELGVVSHEGAPAFFVRDNGAGFDPAYGGRLFTPFHRMHSEREFPGTGIGLAIVSRIIRRHGGKVWAESKPGEGATFYFVLPDNVMI